MSAPAATAAAASRQWINVVLVLAGALLLSAKGIFAKLLYAEGVEVEALLLLRALISLPLFLAWALWKIGAAKLLRPPLKPMLWSVFAGFATYYGGAMLDFRALELISASLERVLLFSYPALVVLMRALWLRRLPSKRVLAAVMTTYAGVLLAVGGFDAGLWRANALGAALVMAAAILFAVYLLVNEFAARQFGSIPFLVYAMGAATVALALHFLAFGDPAALHLSQRAWLLIVIMTVVTNVVPSFFIAESIRRIGAQRGAILTTIGPPATIVMGVVILGETMHWFQVAGSACIIAGILILEARDPRRR